MSEDAHQTNDDRTNHPEEAIKSPYRSDHENRTGNVADCFADESDLLLEAFRIAIVPPGPCSTTESAPPRRLVEVRKNAVSPGP